MNYSKIISFAMSLVLVFTLLPVSASAVESSFSDVPSNHWAVDVIDEMVAAGVMNGVGDNKFAPDKPVTYAEFATMLIRYFYSEKVEAVRDGEPWYAPYLSVLETSDVYWRGLIRDDSQGTTSIAVLPEDTLTRYDMARLIRESVPRGYLPGYDTGWTGDLSNSIADWTLIPINYRQEVADCYAKGWLTGVDSEGTFGGTATMTRAQAAAVMSRLMASRKPPVTEIPDYIPANATKINSKDQLWYSAAVEVVEGEFHCHPDYVRLYGSHYIEVNTTGCCMVSFTLVAEDEDVLLSCFAPNAGNEDFSVAAGTTKNVLFNCAGSEFVRISASLDSGNSLHGVPVEAWITNLYVY